MPDLTTGVGGTGGHGGLLHAWRPLRLTPVLVEKPWGGRRLERLSRTLPPGAAVGESWEVADLDSTSTSVTDSATRVASGPHAGATLHDLIVRDPGAMLGDGWSDVARFPLLVKLLDAREALSVQVHPPQGYVADHPGSHVKTETWVVLDADPGAELLIGLVDGVTPDMLADVAGTPGMLHLLRRVPAVPGTVFHLPAGLLHALGEGMLVAEVQTPSDTTFRLYDWSAEYARPPRTLHLREGLECVRIAWEHNVAPPPSPAVDATLLVDAPQYRLLRHPLAEGSRLRYPAGRARVLQVVEGRLGGEDLDGALGPVDAVVLPAAWSGTLHAVGHATVLEAVPQRPATPNVPATRRDPRLKSPREAPTR